MPLAGEVEIDHRRLDGCMAEIALDDAQVHPLFQQVSSVGMPQSMDVHVGFGEEHPGAVNVVHFQVECFLQTKPARVNSMKIGAIVGRTHRGEEFYDLLFGEDCGENLWAFRFQVAENVPFTLQNLLEKEFEGVRLTKKNDG